VEDRAKTTAAEEAPRRFLFDQSFDVAPRARKKPKPEEEKPPEPTFSQEELDAARQEGYAKGHAEGAEEAASGLVADVARLVAVIGERLPALSEAQAAANERLLHDGARLVTAIARKILPAYTARHGVEEIDALVRQCLQTLIAKPRITVHVGEPYADAVRDYLEDAVTASAFDGRFSVEADADLGPSDCRIQWQDGALERREDDIWKQIEEATEAFLAGMADDAAVKPDTDDANGGADAGATPADDTTTGDDADMAAEAAADAVADDETQANAAETPERAAPHLEDR
jgi:flagellar assembly protein FliH